MVHINPSKGFRPREIPLATRFAGRPRHLDLALAFGLAFWRCLISLGMLAVDPK